VSTVGVVAVDGGNSKTDVALVASDGTLLAHVRGGASSPHHLGADRAVDVLDALLDDAVRQAGLARDGQPVAEVAQVLLAGVDFPSDEEEVRELAVRRRWGASTNVGNDTFAVLRAGTERGWGVAITCGAGINCVGVGPDGRHVRFLSLGAITGDWGGGYDVGLAAQFAAARSEDGRGAKTTLERSVPAHFGFERPSELAEAIHRGAVPHRRLIELAPLVFAEAGRDGEAAAIVDHLAAEVVAMARAALTRLDLLGQPAEVLLGGGLLRSGDARLIGSIEAGLREVSPRLSVHATSSPAIVGAALLGLDELAAAPAAQERLRRELGRAVEGADG
jgi:N-acetylglucosamine kinase-like BadF-type ATPase